MAALPAFSDAADREPPPLDAHLGGAGQDGVAEDIGGVLFPVASAWLSTWEKDPGVQLYSDGLHASVAGSYLAALVMYARIFERTPVGLPATVRTHDGVTVRVDPSLALTLQEAAASVTVGASSW